MAYYDNRDDNNRIKKIVVAVAAVIVVAMGAVALLFPYTHQPVKPVSQAQAPAAAPPEIPPPQYRDRQVPEITVPSDPAAATDQTKPVMELQIGPVALGDPTTKIKKALGQPKSVKPSPADSNCDIWQYPGQVWLTVHRKENRVTEITVLTPAWPTARGIKVGDPVDKAQAAYGKLLGSEFGPVYRIGDTYRMQFILDEKSRNKIAAIYLYSIPKN